MVCWKLDKQANRFFGKQSFMVQNMQLIYFLQACDYFARWWDDIAP